MTEIEQLMKDPQTEMTDEFLAMVLGNSFAAWQAFNGNLPEYDLALEWRYYKDGGWLAKVTHKKKTIIWVWASAGFFGANFGFPEKPHLRAGIGELDIADELKKNITSTPKGTYFSVAVNIHHESQLPDVYKLIEYKKRAK